MQHLTCLFPNLKITFDELFDIDSSYMENIKEETKNENSAVSEQ